MIFADGENLVWRYQAMLEAGWQPRDDVDCHIQDVVVWHKRFSHSVRMEEVLRATYYTYVVGDEPRVRQIQDTIRGLSFKAHRNTTLPTTLTPRVFKKHKKHAKGKGVDIAMVVDVLTHVHHDNVDSVLLLTGDGDYIPLIQEVQRSGKQCYVSAFSDGLHPDLPLIADRFNCLDGIMFPNGDPAGA